VGFDELPRPRLWRRLVLGGVLVVCAAAAATAVAAFHEIDKVVDALELGPELKLSDRQLATSDPGKPQTLMILGSDDRGEGAEGARSDTVMLVRLDPDEDAIAIMSLPRDLKVEIPGHGVDKLNAAYSAGGADLTLRTVKKLTGISVNHVINVDFRGFWAAVNALGCVYADIDRRYYNASAAYSFIDVQAGYQRMCGREALQYVRFRHEDTDIVRAARQQDFLRQMKQQVVASDLLDKRDRLLRIFGRNTSTDGKLRDRAEILRLLKLALASSGKPIRQIVFQGQIGPSYVEASQQQIDKLVQDFLDVADSPGPRGTIAGRRVPRAKRRPLPAADLGLEDAGSLGEEQALAAVAGGAGASLPVLYPRLRVRGSLYVAEPRLYKLRGTDGKRYGAYRMVINRGVLGEYYGMQGMTWKDPPILDSPTETRRVGGRVYELHHEGDRLRIVAWRTRKAVYWISNTLLLSLTNRQMMAIARSATRCC
jgi:polyisoprenyl-teichoic acid--peptidoglycan teichoic acid transferase